MTWLNVINDRGIGLAGKVFYGTPRDFLHMIDVVYSQDGGQLPDVIVSGAGSYSDLVFGLVHSHLITIVAYLRKRRVPVAS